MRTSDFLEEVENLGYGFSKNGNAISINSCGEGVYRRISTIDRTKKGVFDIYELYRGYNSENDDELLRLIFEYVTTPPEERELPDGYAYLLKDYTKNQYFGYVLLNYGSLGLGLYKVTRSFFEPGLLLPEGCVFEEENPILNDVDLSMFEKVAVTRSGEIINE